MLHDTHYQKFHPLLKYQYFFLELLAHTITAMAHTITAMAHTF